MEKNYAAFISYRHCPLDMAVAEKLHKRIERYRVPKDLRKAGEKSLGVVFRDRDELPLSNNLTEDIFNALDHSQFLIVVCTPETPKSLWVDREIQHFVEKHGHERVLTVLAAGTEAESIPQRITRIYGEDGKTVIGEAEPLCAYLVDENPKKVLRNLDSEFLRLAAAMLHCPYDALKQRQKRYRNRKIFAGCAAGAAVLLTVMGLLLQWNLDVTQKNEEILQINTQLEEAHRQSQLNESRALALLSENLLEQGDRMGALDAAVQALPHSENDRPYYRFAQIALEKALGLLQRTYLADRKIEEPNGFYNVTVSEDGRYALAVVGDELITCYDLYTGVTLWSCPMPDTFYPEELRFLPEQKGVLYISKGGNYYLLNMEDGSLRFSYDFDNRIFPDGYAWDQSQLVVAAGGCAGFCDLTKEEIIWSAPVVWDPDSPVGYECEGAYSADDSRVLLLKETTLELFLFDPATGVCLSDQRLTQPQGDVLDAVVLGLEDGSFFVRYIGDTALYCYHISITGEILAKNKIDLTKDETRVFLDKKGKVQQAGEYVLLAAPYGIRQIHIATCAQVAVYGFEDDQTFCRFFPGGSCILQQAQNTIQLFELNADGVFALTRSWESPFNLEHLAFTRTNPDVFGCVDDDLHIIRWVDGYDSEKGDSRALSVALSGNLIYLPKFCGIYSSPSGDHLLLLDKVATGNEPPRQYVYAVTEDLEMEIPAQYHPGHQAVFTSDEKGVLDKRGIYRLDTGVYEELAENLITMDRNDQKAGEPVLSAAYDAGTLSWWLDGVFQGKTQDPWNTDEAVALTPGQNGYILRYCPAGEVPYAAYDIQRNTWQQLDIPLTEEALVHMAKTAPLAAFAAEDGHLYVYDFSENALVLSLADEAHQCMLMSFLQEDRVLLTASWDGRYTVVDVEAKTVLQHLRGEFSYQGLGPEYLQVQEDPAGQWLYISSAIAEFPGIVVETETWTIQWELDPMVGYLPSQDAILFAESKYRELTVCQRLPLEELLYRGKELLAGRRE